MSSYLSSVIASATNAPGHPLLGVGYGIKDPNLDIGATLQQEVALPADCVLTDSESLFFLFCDIITYRLSRVLVDHLR